MIRSRWSYLSSQSAAVSLIPGMRTDQNSSPVYSLLPVREGCVIYNLQTRCSVTGSAHWMISGSSCHDTEDMRSGASAMEVLPLPAPPWITSILSSVLRMIAFCSFCIVRTIFFSLTSPLFPSSCFQYLIIDLRIALKGIDHFTAADLILPFGTDLTCMIPAGAS